MSFERLNDALESALDRMDAATTKEEMEDVMSRITALSKVGNLMVGMEKVKVEQGKVLLAAGLKLEVAGIVVQKEEKDAHPKIFKR